jgi:hypothetical protein
MPLGSRKAESHDHELVRDMEPILAYALIIYDDHILLGAFIKPPILGHPPVVWSIDKKIFKLQEGILISRAAH